MRTTVPGDFDEMAAVVDWLDACRNQDLDLLLDACAADVSMDCACENIAAQGRDELAAYWKPKLAAFTPAAFGLREISPLSDGVALEYLNSDAKPVRIHFAFDAQGKIARMVCEWARC